MKKTIRLSELELVRLIKEAIDLSYDKKGEDISKSFIELGHNKWFNQGSYSLLFTREMIHNGLIETIKQLSSIYGTNMKRLVAKDGDKIVGFIIYSLVPSEKDSLGDGKTYPVIISVAVDPYYRNKGVMNQMMTYLNLPKPFLVHTNDYISPKRLWTGMGCKLKKRMVFDNKLYLCK